MVDVFVLASPEKVRGAAGPNSLLKGRGGEGEEVGALKVRFLRRQKRKKKLTHALKWREQKAPELSTEKTLLVPGHKITMYNCTYVAPEWSFFSFKSFFQKC